MNTFTAQEIFKEALYAKDLRLKILKGKPGAGLHKNNLENNQNTGESNLEIHANEVEIGEKNNKKTEMAAGTKITSAVHANNTRKIGKILKISLRKGKKSSNKKVTTLKVSFSCHTSSKNVKILFSFRSTFKFGIIFTYKQDEQKRLSKHGSN